MIVVLVSGRGKKEGLPAMRARWRYLLDHSLSSILSAIEIYNKPDFRDREQIFSILVITAWEVLFKAKILKDNQNMLQTLYEKEGRHYKRNRTGQYKTLGLRAAMNRCSLSKVVEENIECFLDIRDAAVHLTTSSSSLPYLVFTLGSATLRNYARLVRDWFGVTLNDYNFYILPIGFSYPFKTLSTIDRTKEPGDVARIIQAVEDSQARGLFEDGEFFLMCELRTTLVSAKKTTADTDLTAKIDQASDAQVIVQRKVNLIEQYPYTFRQIWTELKQGNPLLKQSDLHTLIKDLKIKGNPQYAAYNYASKLEEQRGPSKMTKVIYNDDFLQLAKAKLSV